MLSPADAARLAVVRGRLMQGLPEGGGMLAVNITEAEAAAALDGVTGVVVAAVNGPDSLVLSGDGTEIDRQARQWGERGVRTSRLQVSHAFHSPLMEPMLKEFGALLEELDFHEATSAIVPTGDSVHPVHTPEYWADHARYAVRFHDAVTRLPAGDVVIEIGPGAVLTPLLAQRRDVTASCHRTRPETRTVLEALGHVHARGVTPDWAGVLGDGRPVPLPTYAFRHEHYWLASQAAPEQVQGSAVDQAFWDAVEKEDMGGLAGTLGAPAELEPALPALARWHRDRRHRQRMDSWRYRVVFKPADRAPVAQVPGSWLVVLPPGGGDPAVARAVTRLPADAVTVELGAGNDRRATAGLLAEAAETTPLLSGVLSLVQTPEELLVLVQALGDAEVGARLWCLTRRAVATVDGEEPDPAGAALWGVGLVAGLEHPERWGGLIDLPETLDERAVGRLGGVLAADDDEDQLAVRAAGVLSRRLVPAPAAAEPGRSWRPDGPVLITGGTGAIGAHVARWLTSLGPCSLVLVSRRGIEAPGAERLREELRERGARVRIEAADVTDRAGMAELTARIAAEEGPVRAVFHAAGLGQSTPIDAMTLEEFRAVCAAKTSGAQVLDELFDGVGDLGAFVLFSSASAIWGSGHYASYAAGNSYLDALAERRRARGLAATSVAWGVWAQSGILGPQGEEQLRRRGLVPMAPADCVAALAQILDRDETRVTVADVDWEPFLTGYTAARPRPLIEDLPAARALRTERTATSAPARGDIRRRLAGMSADGRRAALTDLVRATVAEVLGHADASSIDVERPFVELGFDSLSAVEVRNKLNVATGLALPTMLVFDHPTVDAVCEFLRNALAEGTRTAGPAQDGAPVEPAESFAAIYRRIALRGRTAEVESLLGGAAALRTRFTDAGEVIGGPGFVRLATGDQGPAIICFPPFAPVEQSLQFARLATYFRDRRDLSMITVPGFLPDEPIAESREVLVDALVRATLRCADGKSFVLLGYSSSGWLAHSVATRLQQDGTPAGGVVLLDTYLPDGMSVGLRQAMTYEVNERRFRFTTMNFTTLTALGAYRKMFRGWEPEPLDVPTLFVRPEECIPGDPSAPPVGDDWPARWPLPHDDVTVPGDHCSIVAEYAESVATEVHNWLAQR
ncbi:SDR family NAD(P)-dependent oxidoreductase [Streptomyces minutiscleroticus]|uniref:SDR family NAD(P)-dependent oxidoreductase n=1 Tax=Streptomyces minutiscleroticus TaxID=68238 RepID=UPI00227D9854|nr:SDR family NAD(P)-dependent oxidoreductase [Streptomyces minutiscleroticus]